MNELDQKGEISEAEKWSEKDDVDHVLGDMFKLFMILRTPRKTAINALMRIIVPVVKGESGVVDPELLSLAIGNCKTTLAELEGLQNATTN